MRRTKMRPISASFRVFCLLFVALCACGCSGRRILSIEPSRTPHLLYEGGQRKEFTALEIREKYWVPGDAMISTYHFLTDGPVPTKDTVRKFEQSLPPHRKIYAVDHIPNLAPVLVETGGTVSDTRELNSTIKWVVGINPVIVAMGDRAEKEWQGAWGGGGYFWDGQARVSGNCRFISEADFHEKVTEIIILDQWPTSFPPDPLTLGLHNPRSVYEPFRVEVKRNLRKVPLPPGTTLGELIKNPSLWAEGAKK